MFAWYTLATGVAVGLLALAAYGRTRDALHPAVLMSPMFIYMYCAWPLILNREGSLYQYFSPGQLEYVALLYFLSITGLYIGLLFGSKRQGIQSGLSIDVFDLEVDDGTRRMIARLGLLLGVIAVSAYLYKIGNVGGFEDAYGRAKGGGRAGSGYISESVLFSFPAVVLYAISRKPEKIGAGEIVIALIMMMPHLLQGTFGGRRGPIFLALATLFVAWFIARRQRPKMVTAIIGIGICGLAVVFVWSQRQDLYLGSGSGVEVERMWEKIVPEGDVATGNTYVAGAATVLMADKLDFTYWGYRYFVTFAVRPIPKQVWPTKYEDMGADWLLRYGDEVRAQRYYNTVGFVPLAGSAVGYVADAFLEFSWGVVLFSYFLGRVFSTVWRRHSAEGQFWSVIYIVMVVLSIYLATQSVTAWAHRLLFIGGITYLLWRYFIKAPRAAGRAIEYRS